MGVRFTKDVEKERIGTRKLPTWGLFSSTSMVETVHWARDNGWAEKKVQVRSEPDRYGVLTYHVEPFEKDCGCKGMLQYSDFFLNPPLQDSK